MEAMTNDRFNRVPVRRPKATLARAERWGSGHARSLGAALSGESERIFDKDDHPWISTATQNFSDD
jgi:hypothetical protein